MFRRIMSFKRLLVVCSMVVVMSPSLSMGEKGEPHAFVSGKRFLEWPSSDRIDYVAGIFDALSYLTESTGIQRGLSDCLKENTIDTKNPITWQLIAKDAVVEAAAKSDLAKVSVTKLLFEQMKFVCSDHYPGVKSK